jgi:hypothetical protein
VRNTSTVRIRVAQWPGRADTMTPSPNAVSEARLTDRPELPLGAGDDLSRLGPLAAGVRTGH